MCKIFEMHRSCDLKTLLYSHTKIKKSYCVKKGFVFVVLSIELSKQSPTTMLIQDKTLIWAIEYYYRVPHLVPKRITIHFSITHLASDLTLSLLHNAIGWTFHFAKLKQQNLCLTSLEKCLTLGSFTN